MVAIEWNNYFENLYVIHHQFHSLSFSSSHYSRCLSSSVCICVCDEFQMFFFALLLFAFFHFFGSFLLFFVLFFFTTFFHVWLCDAKPFSCYPTFKRYQNLVIYRYVYSYVPYVVHLIQISLGVFSCLLYKCLFCRPRTQMDATYNNICTYMIFWISSCVRGMLYTHSHTHTHYIWWLVTTASW